MPGKVFQAKADARIARDLAGQQGIGFDLPDIGGVRALDFADAGVFRIVVDVDDGCEIVMDAELPHLVETRGEYFALLS